VRNLKKKKAEDFWEMNSKEAEKKLCS